MPGRGARLRRLLAGRRAILPRGLHDPGPAAATHVPPPPRARRHRSLLAPSRADRHGHRHIDEVSGGRAILGLGAGGSGFRELGSMPRAPPSPSARRVTLIRGLPGRQTVTPKGEQVSFADGRLDARAPRADVPIYVASQRAATAVAWPAASPTVPSCRAAWPSRWCASSRIAWPRASSAPSGTRPSVRAGGRINVWHRGRCVAAGARYPCAHHRAEVSPPSATSSRSGPRGWSCRRSCARPCSVSPTRTIRRRC